MTQESYKPNFETLTAKKPDKSRQLESVSYSSVEFPKNPEDRFNAVLNIINTENKSLTIGWLLDNKWRTTKDIEKIARDYVFPLIKPPVELSYQKYCTETLIPIGAVAEEKIITKGKIYPVSHFRLTPDGERYAKPIARLALKTAVENKMSMHEIFGNTSSSGETRSPYNRAKILLTLHEQGNICETELADKLKLKLQTVKNSLYRLKEKGLLTYDSISPREPGRSRYEWILEKNPEDVVTIRRHPNLTREVALKMRQIQSSDRNELANAFDEQKSELSGILAGLEKQGFVKNVRKRSNATITEKGRNLTFINSIYQSLKKDDLKDINREIEIFNDNSVSSRYITKALYLYGDISPYSKRTSKEDNKYTVLSMLRNQGLRPEQITENLGKDSNKYLKELLNSRKIIKEKKGTAVYYSLNPKI